MKEDVLLMSTRMENKGDFGEGERRAFHTSEAAKRMNITKRQVRRIMRRFEKYDDKGLIHKYRETPQSCWMKHLIAIITQA